MSESTFSSRRRSRRSLRNRDIAWSYTEVAPNHLEFHEYATADDIKADEKAPLKVKGLGLNIDQNAISHHTLDYDICQTTYELTERNTLKADESNRKLVVRRGQPFDLDLTFTREYKKETDDLRFVFEFGDCPIPSRATHIEFIFSDENIPRGWGAHLQWQSGNKVKVRIFTPPTLYIGKWTFMVDVIDKTDRKKVIFRYKHKDPFYILFNPWCKDDSVYYHDTDALEEYVLNPNGTIFMGSIRRIDSKSWYFGQFDDQILDQTLQLLDRSDLLWTSRGDPIIISRKLSSLVNDKDNRGLLSGRWGMPEEEDPYKWGTAPYYWDGSVEIIQKYFKNKCKPVRYGQCWVFAGLLTTLCRTLGLPCRLLTNFESAHDQDGSITIDIFNGIGVDPFFLDLIDDSVWNFHCWNDVWMARPDLPEGYGGWQVVDATPQERSDGVYCCGPMSVAAIKEGQVCLQYDGPFIYAEVNADEIKWIVFEDGTMEQLSVNKTRVGQFISTRMPACKGKGTRSHNYWGEDREDITHHYKYLEGTPEERVSVITANLLGSNKVHFYDHPEEKKKDVYFEVNPLEDMMYGEGFKITLIIGNSHFFDTRTIDGSITASAIYYTGVKYCNIKEKSFKTKTVTPSEYKTITFEVSFDEYADKLVSQCHLMYSCMFRVKETNQIFTQQEKFQLLKPKLGIQAPPDVEVGEEVEVEVFFRNPLPRTLTKCQLRIQGPGLPETLELDQEDIEPNDYYSHKFELRPLKPGNKEIIASFHSEEIENVCGSCEILIKEPPSAKVEDGHQSDQSD